MISSLYDDLHIVATPVMSTVRLRSAGAVMPLDPNKFMDIIKSVRALFDFIITVSSEGMNHFSSADWVHIIVSCIVAYRISLPMEAFPDFDTTQARRLCDFDSYLEKLCGDANHDAEKSAGGTKTDVCTAFRVVLRSLRQKFNKKLAAVMAKEGNMWKGPGCPMFDGSLDDSITMWDGHSMALGGLSYPTSQSGSSAIHTEPLAETSPNETPMKPMVQDDLWWTISSLGYADINGGDFDSTHTDYNGF